MFHIYFFVALTEVFNKIYSELYLNYQNMYFTEHSRWLVLIIVQLVPNKIQIQSINLREDITANKNFCFKHLVQHNFIK